METEFRKRGTECPQLIDLISLRRDAGGGEEKILRDSDERKLELTLAPPGGNGQGWQVFDEEIEKSICNISPNCYSKLPKSFDKMTYVSAEMEHKSEGFKGVGVLGKESSLEVNLRMEQCHVRRLIPSSQNGSLVKNDAQIRGTSAPAVGWPPIRSFRKNIAITSIKQSNEFKDGAHKNGSKGETSNKGFFVKINMDGIPIGRKVDLNAYDNYETLSSIVEELFSGLLAAQRDPTASGTKISENDRMAFTGLLDGSGEYTLVYEDNEGDRMMVGDVPWDMFVSTAKRLRVLKNSELSALSQLGAVNSQPKESSRVLN